VHQLLPPFDIANIYVTATVIVNTKQIPFDTFHHMEGFVTHDMGGGTHPAFKLRPKGIIAASTTVTKTYKPVPKSGIYLQLCHIDTHYNV
jgi:hypothetical protein